MAEKRQKNLPHRWSPGQSGNPKGRPPLHKGFSETAREILRSRAIRIEWVVNGEKKVIDMKTDKDMYHGIITTLVMESLRGNIQAAVALMDRAEGKPPQNVNLPPARPQLDFTKLSDKQLITLKNLYAKIAIHDSGSIDGDGDPTAGG